MRKIYILIIATFVFINFSSHASSFHEISDIYIESRGNNKFEAKIKAHELGMRRAILIIADKIGINSSAVSKIPYLQLKQVINISFVTNEQETETTYSAIVNYKYDLYSVMKLLRDYGGEAVDSKFYEYIILPIFKQKNVINIWDESKQWNKKWALSREVLDQNKLLYPKGTKNLVQSLPFDKIFSLTYKDFIEVFQPTLVKNIMLAVCEFFTDINTGKSIMRFELTLIGPDTRKVIPFEYQVNSYEEIVPIMDSIINKTIHDYGKLVANNKLRVTNYKNDNIKANQEKSHGLRTILLHSYIYDDESLANIRQKLQNIKAIEDVTIKHDYDKKYKIVILTTNNDLELAENFYLNGLSFKKYGNIYNLIDIVEGN